MSKNDLTFNFRNEIFYSIVNYGKEVEFEFYNRRIKNNLNSFD